MVPSSYCYVNPRAISTKGIDLTILPGTRNSHSSLDKNIFLRKQFSFRPAILKSTVFQGGERGKNQSEAIENRRKTYLSKPDKLDFQELCVGPIESSFCTEPGLYLKCHVGAGNNATE